MLSLATALVACREAPPQRQTPPPERNSFTRAESLYYLDPKEGCDFLKERVNLDPVALVQEYARRDNEGRFLQTDTWLDTAYACPGHLPGPDVFHVVRDTRIMSSRVTDTTAWVLVASNVLGEMGQDSSGFVFLEQPHFSVDTFVVDNTPYGWRIRTPQLPEMVLASWVLANPERMRLRQLNRDSLVRALSRRVP